MITTEQRQRLMGLVKAYGTAEQNSGIEMADTLACGAASLRARVALDDLMMYVYGELSGQPTPLALVGEEDRARAKLLPACSVCGRQDDDGYDHIDQYGCRPHCT